MGNLQKNGEFELIDPFNPQNKVCGNIFRQRSRFGDIHISHVNGSPCQQYVFGTPKILPLEKNIHQISYQQAKIYEKIDGTNILLYRYCDVKGNRFITYKTRLSPFLSLMPYGDFIALWKRMLLKYQNEFALLFESPFHFGFELFGRELRILTDYEAGLDVRLLYAINPADGSVLDPETDPGWNFPKAKKLGEFSAVDAPLDVVFREVVNRFQQNAQEPGEGVVFYFSSGSHSTLYKYKPPEVLEQQARYGDLYREGKRVFQSAANHSPDPERLNKALHSYIRQNWDDSCVEKYGRVIEIAGEDLAREALFNRRREERSGPDKGSGVFDQMVLWKSVWGSHIWGMEKPGSDRDFCIVYQIDSRPLFMGIHKPALLAPHQTGTRNKSAGCDEHWYELGRAVRLLLRGSLSMLYGIMSPLVEESHSTALLELRTLIRTYPSKVFYKCILRYVRDSEKMMKKAKDHDFYLKHLRIACRDLQFGITLFEENRYEFKPCYTEDPGELGILRMRLINAFEASTLPELFDPAPFDEFILRWRCHRYDQDFPG